MFNIGYTPDKEKSFKKIKRQVTRINKELLETGMDIEGVTAFWEECMAEAVIQHELPPCSCKDVNQCDTWCQAKSRFVLNPPKD